MTAPVTGPMTPLEERLTAALAERAGQIVEADLGPAVVPDPAVHRSRGLVVLAAAACTALVIGVPYAIAQLDNSSEPPRPPTSAPPSPTAPSGVGEGADWPVAEVGRIDLDGDGTDETMRLRLDPTVSLNPMGYAHARVEVDQPGGTVYTVLGDSPEYHLEGVADLPGSDGQELLLGERNAVKVLDLVDGRLRVLDAPADPPLIRRIDSQGRSVTWVVDSDGLSTIRSVDPIAADAMLYRVERWRWSIAEGALVAGSPAAGCATPIEPRRLIDCVPDVPMRFEADELTSVPIGTTINFDVGGRMGTARLNAPGFAGDFMSPGDVTLVATLGDQTWEVDLGGGPVPRLYRQEVVSSSSEGFGFSLLVGLEGITSEGFLQFGWVDGELVMLKTPDQEPYPLTTNDYPYQDQKPHITWLQDGWMYTAVAVGEGDAQNVYRWDREGAILRPTDLGRFCVNLQNPDNPC